MAKEETGPIKRKLLSAFERLSRESELEPFLEAIGIEGEEEAHRFMLILFIHLMLDRLLTTTLTAHLLEGISANFDEANRVLEEVADLRMAKRVKLARRLKVISEKAAQQITDVNTARNDLAGC